MNNQSAGRGDTEVGRVAGFEAELNALIRVRRLDDFGRIELPTLESVAERHDSTDPLMRFVALSNTIRDATAKVPEGVYRDAAVALFSAEVCFTSVKERGTAAGLTFGVSYDSFRRRGRRGVSRMDEVLAEVARVLARRGAWSEAVDGKLIEVADSAECAPVLSLRG